MTDYLCRPNDRPWRNLVKLFPGWAATWRVLHVWEPVPVTDRLDQVVAWVYQCRRCGEPGFGA